MGSVAFAWNVLTQLAFDITDTITGVRFSFLYFQGFSKSKALFFKGFSNDIIFCCYFAFDIINTIISVRSTNPHFIAFYI